MRRGARAGLVRAAVLLATSGLAVCGVKGPPRPPEQQAEAPAAAPAGAGDAGAPDSGVADGGAQNLGAADGGAADGGAAERP